jgi:hypothetical protein
MGRFEIQSMDTPGPIDGSPESHPSFGTVSLFYTDFRSQKYEPAIQDKT